MRLIITVANVNGRLGGGGNARGMFTAHTQTQKYTEIYPIHAREYTDNCRSSQAETLLETELGNLLRLSLASDPEKVELHWQNVGWNLWR